MKLLQKRKSDRIIVAGCGRFGCALSAMLTAQGGSITVIDTDVQAFSGLPDSFIGNCIQGGAEDSTILEQAGVQHADVLIAVTGNDNINIMIAQVAKVFYHVPKVIARVQDEANQAAYSDTDIVTVCPMVLTLNSMLQGIGDEKEVL